MQIHSPRLSFDLLSAIYYNSANCSLPLASPCLYLTLSAEHTRLMFCADLFDATYDWDLEHYPRLDISQTEAVARPWFDAEFALKVEEEVARRLHGGNPRVIIGAKLPSRLLRAPWTEAETQLIARMINWDLRAHWSRDRRVYPGLKEAIKENNAAMVDHFLGLKVNAECDDDTILYAINHGALQQMLIKLIGARCRAFKVRRDLMKTEIYRIILSKLRPTEPENEGNCPSSHTYGGSGLIVECPRVLEYHFWQPVVAFVRATVEPASTQMTGRKMRTMTKRINWRKSKKTRSNWKKRMSSTITRNLRKHMNLTMRIQR